MSRENLFADANCDCEIAAQLASEIKEKFDTGSYHLTCIKVTINPQHRKANIYAGYEDTARISETGSEDTAPDLCEALITWPHFECSQNIEENWTDLSFPRAQMERAKMLADELNIQLVPPLSYSEKLKCYIKDGKACIDKI
jgi:hypothetical protein